MIRVDADDDDRLADGPPQDPAAPKPRSVTRTPPCSGCFPATGCFVRDTRTPMANGVCRESAGWDGRRAGAGVTRS